MSGDKTDYTFKLNQDQFSWIKKMQEDYDIADEGKTVRIILDYVMEEADLDEVFEEIRCNHCG